MTSVGISKVHAEQINIYDGQPGHVVDGQQLDSISVSQDGTGIQIKDTTVNGRISIINGANAQIDNLTITCTTSNCVGAPIQGGHIVGSAGTTTDFIGRGLNIDSNVTGLASSGSANIDLTDVTINATGNGLDLNGSVTKNNIANITKIDDFDITAGAHGVYAFLGAEVYLSNGTITTTSDNGIGAYLGGANIGGDIANWSHKGVDRLHVGIMDGYGRSTNDVGPNKLGNSSSGKVDGYSVGLYGTWYENDLNCKISSRCLQY